MLRRVDNDEAEEATELALIMFRTATIRSGFLLQDTADFAQSVEKLVSRALGIPETEPEFEDELVEAAVDSQPEEEEEAAEEEEIPETEEHDEL